MSAKKSEPSRVVICHACGGPLREKRVEKLLRGGVHTAVVEVDAEVCERCGDQLFRADTVRRFEEIRRKLAQQETSEFVPIGQSFQVSPADQPTA
jgi:YgiT-type zinc finger domain-containing protein